SGVHARPHRPGFAAAARQFVVGGTAQALPRGEQRQGFEQVGLAGAVGPGEHDRASAYLERQFGIVAKVGELETLHPQTVMLQHRPQLEGGARDRYASHPHHTRIGINTNSAPSSLASLTVVGEPGSASWK